MEHRKSSHKDSGDANGPRFASDSDEIGVQKDHKTRFNPLPRGHSLTGVARDTDIAGSFNWFKGKPNGTSPQGQLGEVSGPVVQTHLVH